MAPPPSPRQLLDYFMAAGGSSFLPMPYGQPMGQQAPPRGGGGGRDSMFRDIVNAAVPVLLQGNYDPSDLSYGEAINFAGRPGGRGSPVWGEATGASQDALLGLEVTGGPENRQESIGRFPGLNPNKELGQSLRGRVRQDIHKQIRQLMQGGMGHGQARKSLLQYYGPANKQRVREFGREGHSNKPVTNQQVVASILQGNPQAQGSYQLPKGVPGPGQPGAFDPQQTMVDSFQYNVVDPYVQTQYAMNMQAADGIEVAGIQRAQRLRDPNRRALAEDASHNLAQIMRLQAAYQRDQYLSPYGQKGTLGYILGKQTSGQRAMWNMLDPFNPMTASSYEDMMQGGGGGGMDFASMVLNGGGMGGQQQMGGMSPTAMYDDIQQQWMMQDMMSRGGGGFGY